MRTLAETKMDRRTFVRSSAVAGAAWLAVGRGRPAAAQGAPRIVAARVDRVPLEPDASEWAEANATEVSLQPQNITTPRIREAGVKSLRVRALYDADRLGILAEWSDPSRQEGLGTVASFRDALAVQFSSHPEKPTPYFGMGGPGTPVTIYQWKSDWQLGPQQDVDEAYPHMFVPDVYPFSGVPAGAMAEATDYKDKGDLAYVAAWKAGNPLADLALQGTTSVEKLTAEGFGTAKTSPTQDGQGKGTWANGSWHIVLQIPRAQEAFTLADGQALPVAFAAWDGARSERNGRKAFSTWNELALGGAGLPAAAVGAGAGLTAVIAAAAAALWLRLRRRPRPVAG